MKRSYGRRRVTRRTRVSAKRRRPSFAKKVRAVVSRVAESKYRTLDSLESVITTQSASYNYSPGNVFQLPQGSGSGERIGAQVNGQSVTWRMVFKNNSLANVYVRLIVVERFDTDTGLYGDLFMRGGTAAAQYGDLRDITTPLNRRTYRIKRDYTFTVGYSGSDWPVAMRKIVVPYKHRLEYKNSVGSTNPRKYLEMLMIARRGDADEPVGGDQVEVTTTVELKFNDV